MIHLKIRAIKLSSAHQAVIFVEITQFMELLYREPGTLGTFDSSNSAVALFKIFSPTVFGRIIPLANELPVFRISFIPSGCLRYQASAITQISIASLFGQYFLIVFFPYFAARTAMLTAIVFLHNNGAALRMR